MKNKEFILSLRRNEEPIFEIHSLQSPITYWQKAAQIFMKSRFFIDDQIEMKIGK